MKNETKDPGYGLPPIVRSRPLTLREVLKLRDGMNIPQGVMMDYPAQLVLVSFINTKEWTLQCLN